MFYTSKRTKEQNKLKAQINELHGEILSKLQNRRAFVENLKNSNLYIRDTGEIIFVDNNLLQRLGYDSLFKGNISSITNAFNKIKDAVEGEYEFIKKSGDIITMHCKPHKQDDVIYCYIHN